MIISGLSRSFPYFPAFSVFRYSPGALRPDAWEVLSPAFMGRSVGLWTRLQYVQPCPTVECPQARRAGLQIAIGPGIFHGRVRRPISEAERRPGPTKENRPGRKTLILIRIRLLRPITEGSTSPPHGFATPGDSAMLEFLPVPTTNQPRRDQVEKMPDGVKRPSARQLGVSTNSRSDPIIHNLRRADSPAGRLPKKWLL